MSKISYDALAVDGLKDILRQVSTACKELEIDFFITGAVARNIWLASHHKNVTGTKDIDFGIYIPSEKKYNQLRKKLLDEYAYNVSRNNEFCLITTDGKQIDLLPFGEIEEEGQIMIEGKGLTKIGLDGFRESYEMGITRAIIGKDIYSVCTIPAIVVLKLIAFDDRPEHRIKDVKDLNSICQHYPDIETESIWSEHFDLYDDNREHQEVAMIALGREIKKIIKGNKNLKERIVNIINKALRQKSSLLRHMIENVEKETIEMKAKLLENIKQGIEE